MLLRKYIIPIIWILGLGLCACGKYDKSESEIQQTNIVEMETAVTEASSEIVVEMEAGGLLDAARVVDEQTFDVNLEGWGDVTFVTYKPENEGDDAEYKLFQNKKEIYDFDSWEAENYVATKAVAFRDYNGDGYKDVIIITQYKDLYEQIPEYYDMARVFIQIPEEQKFLIDNLLCEALSKNHHADSVESVMAYREEYLSHIPWYMPENISYAESKVIADACDMWLEIEDSGEERYAVVDMDKNGRAEIVVSHRGGSGFYTGTRIFEVNERHDGLEEVETDFVQGDSQPDMISYDEPIEVYVDENFVFHYIVEDYLRVYSKEVYFVIYDVTLQDGYFSTRVLASQSVFVNSDDTKEIVYKDANGQEITEEAYNSIAETVFADARRKESHIWGWQDLQELKDLSNEELRKKIDESFLKQKVMQ